MTVADKAVRRRLSLSWLRPPRSESSDGTMALIDHLKELRYRLIVSTAGFVLMFILAFVLENTTHIITDTAVKPLIIAINSYQAAHPGADVMLTTEGVMGGFTLQVVVSALGALIMSCPIWIWQLWAFVMPALLPKEKQYTLRFMGAAIPLFLLGLVIGYLVLPKAFSVMLGFNPPGSTNLQNYNVYISFELRMLLIFGASFLLPVLLVALNLIGVLRARMLSKYRNIAIFCCFVFAAVATPSTDPISMLALGLPMAVMYVISEVITHAHDRQLRAQGKLPEVEPIDD